MSTYTQNLDTKAYCSKCSEFKEMGLILFENKDGYFLRAQLVCRECNSTISNLISDKNTHDEIKRLVDTLEKYADEDNWEVIDEYGKYGPYSMTVWHPFGYEDGYSIAQSTLDDSVFAQDIFDFWPV